MPLDSKRTRTRTKNVSKKAGSGRSGTKKKTIAKPGDTRSRTVTYEGGKKTVTRSRQRHGVARSVDKTVTKTKGKGDKSKTMDKTVYRQRATGGTKIKNKRTKAFNANKSRSTKVTRDTRKASSVTTRSGGTQSRRTRSKTKGPQRRGKPSI